MNIQDHISHDREKPTTKRHLTAVTGRDERSVRSLISAARRRGVPIIGLLTGGYYITDSPEEWKAFVEQERRRAVATFKKTALLDAGATGQMTVFDSIVQHEREGEEPVAETTVESPGSIQTGERQGEK